VTNNTIYLIDGTSICYRSFYAINLSTSKGFPTGAIYGFHQTLKKITLKFAPEYLAICFDVSRKTFRQEKFKDYKIQRPPTPDALKTQIPRIKELIAAMGITLIEKEGFEADDIIFSLTKKAIADKFSTVIVTSDKDMYQLLGDRTVAIYNPTRDALMREEDFVAEFGFPSSLILDYLALTGDSSDNIPGAKGIGKVGALKLIKEFKTVENIFANIDHLSPRLQKILMDNKDTVFLSKNLVTLVPCELALTWEALKVKGSDEKALISIFSEFEFKNFLKDLAPAALNVKIDIKECRLRDVRGALKDTMTFSIDDDTAYIATDDETICKSELSAAMDLLRDEHLKKISYDFKEQMLHASGVSIKGAWFDVKIAAYVDDPSLADYELSTLISHYLGDFVNEVPAEAVALFSHKLYKKIAPRLKEGNLEDLFFKVEMPLLAVLRDMEAWGVTIDIGIMGRLLKDIEERLKETAHNIFAIAGKEFNLNSPAQLRVVLFEDLKITPLQKTKTGFSTSEEVLTKLADAYPIAHHILEYRELNKLKTTYIVPLLEIVKLQGGRLHAKFNQTATQTGRLSSSSPNLQSIPAKGKFSANLRKAFIASFSDGFILSGDYSQIELRILAHFSGDKALREAFAKDADIHSFTASLLFGVKEAEVTGTQRNLAKKVNFGILYGMSSYGLAAELNVPVMEAQNFIDNYFLRYPKVKTYIERVYREAERTGYVQTILGRRRMLPDIKSQNMHLKEFAQRQAINTPIQGSCADIIKTAMINIHREFKAKTLRAQLIMQIHDELIFDVPKEEVATVTEIVRRIMEKSIPLDVPVKVNCAAGKNWAEMETIQ
jgi:DNA polymerase-1